MCAGSLVTSPLAGQEQPHHCSSLSGRPVAGRAVTAERRSSASGEQSVVRIWPRCHADLEVLRAVLFGLGFLLLFLTKFTKMFTGYGIPLAFTVLMAVGAVTCITLARRPPNGRRSRT